MGVPDLGIGMQLVCGSFVVVNVDLIHDWSVLDSLLLSTVG